MSKIVYKNKFFKVEEYKAITRNRNFMAYRVIETDVVVILPIIDKNHILIEQQYRSVIENKIYEIPAGHINKGEKPEVAAKRELEEETGYKANKIKLLTRFYPSPGILASGSYLYLAEDLRKGKLSLDKDEEIKVIKISIDKTISLIKSGKIKDAKTIIALLYYKSMLK